MSCNLTKLLALSLRSHSKSTIGSYVACQTSASFLPSSFNLYERLAGTKLPVPLLQNFPSKYIGIHSTSWASFPENLEVACSQVSDAARNSCSVGLIMRQESWYTSS